MKIKGVGYDAGAVMGMNWHPDFDLRVVRREFEIIKKDLHCNAVRIGAQDIGRLTSCTQAAMEQGLDVWFCPLLWDKSPQTTLEYLTKAAVAAEAVRGRFPDRKMVFVAGGELTLFMRGILEGRNFTSRLSNPTLIPRVKAGEHNSPLNDFLSKANSSIRQFFHGQVTYASLVWEKVDWSIFDFVGVDHYRMPSMGDRYIEMLKPSLSHGKPVVITEFGFATTHGGLGEEGFLSSSGLRPSMIDIRSQFLHYRLPILGRFVRPHLNGDHVRDEAWQARELVETLSILDKAGVHGAFISEFVSQITPYDEVARYDLDMASSSLVKYYDGGRRHGTTYPDMPWEPKESFRAVAGYYASH